MIEGYRNELVKLKKFSSDKWGEKEESRIEEYRLRVERRVRILQTETGSKPVAVIAVYFPARIPIHESDRIILGDKEHAITAIEEQGAFSTVSRKVYLS